LFATVSNGTTIEKARSHIDADAEEALRADRPPTEGFVTVVDGHFKTEFATVEAAEAAGRKLKSAYPMLQIEIYDSAAKTRTLLKLANPAVRPGAVSALPSRAIAAPTPRPLSCGVNLYTDEQNSQVTTTLPSLTISARSCWAKLLSIAETASREQEHCARNGSGANHPHPGFVEQAIEQPLADRSGSSSSMSSTVEISD